MPIYVYKCAEHGHFETLRSFSEASEEIECPVCGVIAERVYRSVLPIL